jgi:TonB family protein
MSGKKKMSRRWLVATSILVIVLSGAAGGRAQTAAPVQAPDPAVSSAPLQKIVTKDPEYLKLMNPPKENAFLHLYSKSYRDELAETEAKVADITDGTLRNQALNDEWVKVLKNDGDKFIYESEVGFRDAKISFSQKHRDGWYEAGRIYYDRANSMLVVSTNSTTPIDANLRFPMKVATLNEIYEKFHQLAAEDIDRKAHEYVAKSGPGSNCARNPDWCLPLAKDDIEEKQRTERIVVVAQGDPEAGRIDHFLLVDYDTETILMNLDDPASTVTSGAWRFSVGPVPVMPKPAPTEAEAKPAASEPVPVTVTANVTSASIVTQTTPEYPPEARARNVEGEVLLHATIDKEGKISQVQVLSGDDLLAKSAVEAVRQWRYKPMLVDGEAKETDTTITVTFSLKE